MAQWIPGGTWNSKVHQEAQAKRSVPSVHQIKELRTRLINSRQMWRNHSVPIGTNSTTVLKSLRVYWSTRKQRQRYTVRPPSGSLRSSRFLSFFRPRGDRTSERKAGERRSTPGVSQKVGENCLFCHSFAVFLAFASVWKRKGNGCYASYPSGPTMPLKRKSWCLNPVVR